MQLGNLKQNANGIYTGRIASLSVAMTIALRPWEASKENSKLRFEILALTPARTWVRVGFLFEQIKNDDTGEAFLQGSVDDPSMSKPLYIACFMEPDGSYNVVWSRPRRSRNELAPATDGPGNTDAPADDDGLGESTAPGAGTNDGLPPIESGNNRSRRRAEQAQDKPQEEAPAV